MKIFLLLLAVGTVNLAAQGTPSTTVLPKSPGPTNTFAIRDVRVFDGERVLQHATVFVKNGLIAGVEQAKDVPSGVGIVDGRGKTLIPGLIDSHVHLSPGAQHDALRFGVTTVMDMFNTNHDFSKWRAQRDSLVLTDEADAWSAGTGITVPGGHPTEMGGPTIPTLTMAADAAAFVDARLAEGSDYIKLILENGSEYGPKFHFDTLSPEEIRASVNEASRLGKMTIAHIGRQEDARLAIACGVRGLAHMFFDQEADQTFIQLAKERHIFIIATLSVWAGSSGTDAVSSLIKDPAIAPLLSEKQKGTLGIAWPSIHPERLSTAEKNTYALFKAGIPILAGTDAPVPSEAHGVTIHEELSLLVKAGLTPMEALNAATAKPAAVFNLWDRGRISSGLRADMVLIDGDPTTDITLTRRIETVWKNGYSIQRRP